MGFIRVSVNTWLYGTVPASCYYCKRACVQPRRTKPLLMWHSGLGPDFHYILTVIDSFSEMAYVHVLKRKTGNLSLKLEF